MKLIENPIRLNASLHKMLPYTMRYLYGQSTVKAFRLYTLGSVHVYFIEGFEKDELVMTHDTRNIKDDEIDFVVAKLFDGVAKDDLTINHAAKNQIEADLHRKVRVKDLVIIEKRTRE
ncbi:DUF1827 family protein [Lacticaseibacillus daqingensis]|uniref:DUF1827 family protein n=1 Tax=Lacticaseibacillus daqingensis TaxID=2486014 RepID=UPI000F79833E|nr:DUF1827 family protein [Lacticaseibacillus daqingensis]